MTSEIRVNSLTNRSGLSTVSITDTGVVVAGILTANTGSFSGNVSVGGTLTYEDVTYVDSVGIITAQAGIDVTGGNVGIGTDNPFAKLHVNITSPTTVPAAGSNSHPVVIGDVVLVLLLVPLIMVNLIYKEPDGMELLRIIHYY